MPFPVKDIVLVLGFALALSLAYFKGAHDIEVKWQLKDAKRDELERMIERQWQEKANEIIRTANKRNAATQLNLDAALERLRNRPERLPEAARGSCAGATGAELAGRDAAFLAGYAADAARLQVAFDACKSGYFIKENENGN